MKETTGEAIKRIRESKGIEINQLVKRKVVSNQRVVHRVESGDGTIINMLALCKGIGARAVFLNDGEEVLLPSFSTDNRSKFLRESGIHNWTTVEKVAALNPFSRLTILYKFCKQIGVEILIVDSSTVQP